MFVRADVQERVLNDRRDALSVSYNHVLVVVVFYNFFFFLGVNIFPMELTYCIGHFAFY